MRKCGRRIRGLERETKVGGRKKSMVFMCVCVFWVGWVCVPDLSVCVCVCVFGVCVCVFLVCMCVCFVWCVCIFYLVCLCVSSVVCVCVLCFLTCVVVYV